MIIRVHHHDEGYLFLKKQNNTKPFFSNDIDNQFQALPSPR